MTTEPYITKKIHGWECNIRLSRDRTLYREIVILVGPSDRPGWRNKDGARAARWQVRAEVIAALESDPMAAWILDNHHPKRHKRIRVQARYSCLSVSSAGLIERRDDTGHVIGTYLP